ncbi:MAG: DUF6077 domain-containing protein [Lachnospiraceae bacterium]|nr:DUF6077 domain-containing protein [Lachnospiraceae bacterium]
MSVYLRIGAAALTELLLFFIIGGLFPVRQEDGGLSVTETMCGGFLIEYSCLEAAALLCTYLAIPLSYSCFIWAGVIGLLCAASLVLRSRENLAALRKRLHFSKNTAWFALLLIGGAGFVVLSVLLSGGVDTTGIIAQMNTDLYEQSLSLADGRNGDLLQTMTTGAFLNRYYVGGEFFALLFNITALTQMKMIQQGITTLFFVMISSRIFGRLYDGRAGLTVLSVYLLMLLTLLTRTPYSTSTLILDTGWTGNAILLGILLPTILLMLLKLYEKPESRRLFLLFMCSGICAVSLSETALLLVPLVLTAGTLPIAVMKKAPALLLHLVLWVTFPLLMAVFCGYLPGGGAVV